MKSGYHGFTDIRISKHGKSLLEGVFYVMWWEIWRFRNSLVFGLIVPKKETLFDDIVTLTYVRFSNRCKPTFNWVTWIKNSMSVICRTVEQPISLVNHA